ncbi:hypothetical protein CTI12_AA095280 [Artemisia annua]|uniref:Uncharacterized protein n=1 Tax=Artemisia annua TaxID=35608 RepID=A0A2U1PZ75_ARTAN|nr:hypothetical protein CTI12_AA095280 [Artemisia annua]
MGLLMDVIVPSLKGQMVSSTGGCLCSATLAASSASAMAVSIPFAYRPFFGVDGRRVASYDASPTSPIFTADYLICMRTVYETIFGHYITKEYSVELKPLFSAFQMKPFALTTIRSFGSNYSRLVQPNVENDDNDFDPDDPRHVGNQGMPFHTYTFCVGRTTFIGYFLGVAASWLVEVGIECYGCVRDIIKSRNEGGDVYVVHQGEQAKVFGKRVCGITARRGASLVFASIGAGIGATLFRPTTGQSIGCMLGDMVGPIIMSLCFATIRSLVSNYLRHVDLVVLFKESVKQILLDVSVEVFVRLL